MTPTRTTHTLECCAVSQYCLCNFCIISWTTDTLINLTNLLLLPVVNFTILYCRLQNRTVSAVVILQIYNKLSECALNSAYYVNIATLTTNIIQPNGNIKHTIRTQHAGISGISDSLVTLAVHICVQIDCSTELRLYLFA